jgi:hypothetical protein
VQIPGASPYTHKCLLSRTSLSLNCVQFKGESNRTEVLLLDSSSGYSQVAQVYVTALPATSFETHTFVLDSEDKLISVGFNGDTTVQIAILSYQSGYTEFMGTSTLGLGHGQGRPLNVSRANYDFFIASDDFLGVSGTMFAVTCCNSCLADI